MTQQYTPNVGEQPLLDARRDCIHVAVAPVVAGEDLPPGVHVGIMDNLAWEGENPIGVVDPFRKDLVQTGERFWLFLMPGSVTSIRHQWTHPAFAPARKDARDE